MAKETYEVGPSSVFGHEPGEEFTAELNPVQRGRLLESGALKRVTHAKGEKSAVPKDGGDHKGDSQNG